MIHLSKWATFDLSSFVHPETPCDLIWKWNDLQNQVRYLSLYQLVLYINHITCDWLLFGEPKGLVSDIEEIDFGDGTCWNMLDNWIKENTR